MSLRQEPSFLFPEDQVLHYTPGPVVGVVVSNSSRDELSDELSDSDDSDSLGSNKRLEAGFVRVAFFPKGKERVVAEDQVVLVERSLLQGDIVKRLVKETSKSASTDFSESTNRASVMLGQVYEARVYADVRILGSNHVLLDVDSRRLDLAFDPDVLRVVKDVEWIGSVEAFNHVVTLLFKDQSKAIVSASMLLDSFEDTRSRGNRHPDSYFAIPFFYPGQTLVGDLRVLDRQQDFSVINGELDKLLQKAEKKGSGGKKKRNGKKNKRTGNESSDHYNSSSLRFRSKRANQEAMLVEATVVDVRLKDVDVLWWTYNSKPTTSRPPRFVEAEEFGRLRKFNWFPYQTVQVGDPGFLEFRSEDTRVPFNEWKRALENWKSHPNSNKEEREEEEESFLSANDTFEETDEDNNNKKDETKLKAGKKRKHCSGRGTGIGRSQQSQRRHGGNRGSTHPRANVPANLYANLEIGARLPVEILRTSTRISVEWQDGSFERDLASHTLFPERHCGDQDHFCKDFVERVDSSLLDEHEYGVVSKVDVEARMCSVKWYTYDTGKREPVFKEEEDVPVYELREHASFSRLAPETTVYVADTKKWIAQKVKDEWKLVKVEAEEIPKEVRKDEFEIEVGEVMSITSEGEVRVHWGDNVVLNCWPQHLLVLDSSVEANMMHEDDDFENVEEDDGDPEWETEEEEEFLDDGTYKILEISDSLCQLADIINHLGPAIGDFFSLSEVRDTIGAWDAFRDIRAGDTSWLTSDLSSLFLPIQSFINDWNQGQGSGNNIVSHHFGALLQNLRDIRSHLEDLSKKPAAIDSNDNTISHSSGEIYCHISNKAQYAHLGGFPKEMEKCESNVNDDDTSPINDATEETFSETNSSTRAEISMNQTDCATGKEVPVSESVGTFGVLSECPVEAHKFGRSLRPTSLSPNFIKAVRGEMRRLQRSLPSGIHVKGFEDRLDLFSVMVEGATKTPYEHGVFFFDIRLHSDHPRSPPECKYLSLCQGRLNPNLYEDGTVCVSLLGTWSGKNTENWTSDSNLLQLLVSLQSLILVPEPYYNEAGYESHRGTEKGLINSRNYNEMVALKLVQSMTNALSHAQSLRLFEVEVKEHFKRHGLKLAEKMRDLCCDQNQTEDPGYPLLPLSKGLKLSLQKALTHYEQKLEAYLQVVSKDVSC